MTNFPCFPIHVGFNFGVKQNGERVDDVALPPWAKGDPRLFIFKHRQVCYLESVPNLATNMYMSFLPFLQWDSCLKGHCQLDAQYREVEKYGSTC